MGRPTVSGSSEGRLPALDGATGWLNSPPLSPAGLRGHVVVVDFCTYTCINWLRQLPYVRAWATKYASQGLVTIGVHTPEFSFEHDIGNVRRAIATMDVTYPMALDSDYAVWDAFANRYWPALYFVDTEGRIRHHRFGEGDYERSELVIQDLLAEAGATDADAGLVSVAGIGPEAEAAWDDLLSAETYLGYERTGDFASPGGMVRDARHVYEAPQRLELNHWSLAGDWTSEAERVISYEPNGRIELAFHARDVHLVMGPAAPGGSGRFRVSIDGEEPGGSAGSDIADSGDGALDQPRMYQLVRQSGQVVDRVFAIEFLDGGAAAFAFTFG